MPIWLSTLALMLAMVLATEVLFRVGRASGRHDEASRNQITTVQGALLGLLALFLGFTMSMAETRFNARRQIVIAEASAVGSTYRRAELLPEPLGSETRSLLRDYVDARRAFYEASLEDEEPTVRAQALHRALWKRAMAGAHLHPDWDVLEGYISALDEMIQLEARRDLAIGARLPSSIPRLLWVVAIAALGVTGFATGVAGARSSLSLYVVPAVVALTCTVVLDLDQSRSGWISTGDRPMERLERTLGDGSGAALSDRGR